MTLDELLTFAKKEDRRFIVVPVAKRFEVMGKYVACRSIQVHFRPYSLRCLLEPWDDRFSMTAVGVAFVLEVVGKHFPRKMKKVKVLDWAGMRDLLVGEALTE